MYHELINVCEETKPFLNREEILQIEKKHKTKAKVMFCFCKDQEE